MTPITSSVAPVTDAEKGIVSCVRGCLWNLTNTLFNWVKPSTGIDSSDISSLKNRAQFPLCGLPTELLELIFMRCLSSGNTKGFAALSSTNTHSYLTMRELVNKTALTLLCPNLKILDAKTLKFQADLGNIDKYTTLRKYLKLEPFVEGREGLTIVFNQGGLTLKDMKENNCGIKVEILWPGISEALDDIPEKDTEPKMISNAPITGTRKKMNKLQEARVRDKVGFDGKPTLIQYLALLIAAQKELGICLYRRKPVTYARSSTKVGSHFLTVGGSVPGEFRVLSYNLADKEVVAQQIGAGGSSNVRLLTQDEWVLV